MSFDKFNLDKEINDALKEKSFINPTEIQSKAIPLIMKSKDLLAISQTGTGKTAAFMLPIIQHLNHSPKKRAGALVLAPTRELVTQIVDMINNFTINLDIKTLALVGGESKQNQLKAINNNPEIIVSTTGRLLDFLRDDQINVKTIKVVVFDEADRMHDMGFLPEVNEIISFLKHKHQTLLFSATMPPEIRKLAKKALKQPETIQVGEMVSSSNVSHTFFNVKKQLKIKLLVEILKTTATGQVLIFTSRKINTSDINKALVKNGFKSVELQGELSQFERKKRLNGFRDGVWDMMVCTDIAARGIDIQAVSHVINFDLPSTLDDFTHRVGRTGRIGESGEAYSIICREEEEMAVKIQRQLGQTIKREKIDSFDYDQTIVEEVKLTKSQIKAQRLKDKKRLSAKKNKKNN